MINKIKYIVSIREDEGIEKCATKNSPTRIFH